MFQQSLKALKQDASTTKLGSIFGIFGKLIPVSANVFIVSAAHAHSTEWRFPRTATAAAVDTAAATAAAQINDAITRERAMRGSPM